MKLLARNEFKEQVFARDHGLCVVCKQAAVDAHHIIERRLWTDGGYYLDNGVALCSNHHIAAEQTVISCEDLRTLAGIKTTLLPDHFGLDTKFDKWGNPILPNGTRLRGELYFDESFQKIIKNVPVEFASYVKYPRTLHLPWSNPSSDDKIIPSLDAFKRQEIVVTEKRDGENFTGYNDHCHARSTDGIFSPGSNLAKAWWDTVRFEVPTGWRFCGENLVAKHSIGYEDIKGCVEIFSIWDEKNECLSWDDTVAYCRILDIPVVPVLYYGTWDEAYLRNLASDNDNTKCEGYVVRLAKHFSYSKFRQCVAKWVRPDHVTTTKHWSKGKIEYNGFETGFKTW